MAEQPWNVMTRTLWSGCRVIKSQHDKCFSIHLQLRHFPSVSAGYIDMLIYFPLPLQFGLKAIHLFIVFWWVDKAIHHPLVIFWSQILISEPCDPKRSSYDIFCDLRKSERCTHTAICFQGHICPCQEQTTHVNATKHQNSLCREGNLITTTHWHTVMYISSGDHTLAVVSQSFNLEEAFFVSLNTGYMSNNVLITKGLLSLTKISRPVK